MIFVVYEDEDYFKQIIELEIKKVAKSLKIDVEIVFAETTDEVLEYNKSEEVIVNIIDIEYDDNLDAGIVTAKSVRDKFMGNYILFFTSHIEKTYEVLNSFIEPLAYIYKGDPNFSAIFEDAIQKIVKIQNSKGRQDKIIFSNKDGDKLFVIIDEIHFITTNLFRQKYLDIYLYDNVLEVKGSLKDLNKYSDTLVQISRSTLVNKNKIRNIVKDENPKNKIIITKLKDKEIEKNCVLTPKFKSNLT